jgi:hypothetical protein
MKKKKQPAERHNINAQLMQLEGQMRGHWQKKLKKGISLPHLPTSSSTQVDPRACTDVL